MFSGNKNKLERKKLKPLYLAEGGFSLTPPGSLGPNPRTKTTVPFPQTAKEYMTTIGANPKYKNLDSSKILSLYSKDKSTWPKSLDIIEEDCSEPGTCGKTLKYSISPTPATYNWSSRGTTTTVKPATTTTAIKPKTPVSTSTTPVSTAKTTGTTPVSTSTTIPTAIPTITPVVPPVVPPVAKTPVQTTAPAHPYLMQGFNYMTPEDRQRAAQFYGKIENIPAKVDIYQLRRDVPKVGAFKSGGEIKNDRAMVSGVSSILRKIKDKKNRKEVAGDMVKQFNREGVNYDKEKFLKNSRSFAAGGPVKPYYTSNRNDPRLRRYNDSLNVHNLQNQGIAQWNYSKYLSPSQRTQFWNTGRMPNGKIVTSYNVNHPLWHSIYNLGLGDNVLLSKENLEGDGLVFTKPNPFPKPKQPVIYKPAPKKSTMTTMSKASNKKATTTSTTSTTPTVTPTVTTSTTSTVQTPRFNIKGIIADQYVPDSKNPNSRDYRYRVETDKGFDVIQGKKAFDEWKEKNASEYQPYYQKSTNAPIDYNKGRTKEYLEKPTLTYKKGGSISKKSQKAKLSQLYKTFKLKK